MSIHTNPDALAWAKFFEETRVKNGWPLIPDEATMHGWFANAMMAMHDHSNATLRTRLAESEENFTNAAALCAGMHAAAVGEVRGPNMGVVEDVKEIRRRMLAAEAERDALKGEVERLNRDYTYHCEQIRAQRTLLAAAEADLSSLRARCEAAEAEVEKLGRESDEERDLFDAMKLRALAAERSRDEARAEVEAWRAKSDALAKHYESEICQLQALEMNHEGACVRLKAERDEAREALRALYDAVPRQMRTTADVDRMRPVMARARRVLSGEREGA